MLGHYSPLVIRLEDCQTIATGMDIIKLKKYYKQYYKLANLTCSRSTNSISSITCSNSRTSCCITTAQILPRLKILQLQSAKLLASDLTSRRYHHFHCFSNTRTTTLLYTGHASTSMLDLCKEQKKHIRQVERAFEQYLQEKMQRWFGLNWAAKHYLALSIQSTEKNLN